jgi:hypothetical protein
LPLFRGVHGAKATPTLLTVAVGCLTVAVGHFAMALTFFRISRFMMLGCLTVVMGGRFVKESGVSVVRGLSTLPTGLIRVVAVPTARFTARAPGLNGLFGIKFIGVSIFAGRPFAFAGNFVLVLRVHFCKSTFTSHCTPPQSLALC